MTLVWEWQGRENPTARWSWTRVALPPFGLPTFGLSGWLSSRNRKSQVQRPLNKYPQKLDDNNDGAICRRSGKADDFKGARVWILAKVLQTIIIWTSLIEHYCQFSIFNFIFEWTIRIHSWNASDLFRIRNCRIGLQRRLYLATRQFPWSLIGY